MIVEDQGDVEAFLSRPETFGKGEGEVRLVQTHISSVFVGPDRVLKLKRAVRYPYLDFSTPDLRKRFCEAEVAVNRRTAPDLYLGVLPVTREADGSLALDGEGEPVDWVIDMARFEEADLFDRLAREGHLDRGEMTDLAQVIADFHATAAPRPESGGREGLAYQIDGNEKAFAQCPEGSFDAAEVSALFDVSRASLDRHAARLEERRRTGHVRHCHGDLHLRNICMIEGRPTLFDAIEFTDAFADIDTFFDFAFLLMDLDHRDLRRLASIVMNAYLDFSGDDGGLAVLPLFLSVRAAIRAHVTATAAGNIEDRERAARLLEEARGYLSMAGAYLDPPEPRLVAVGGLSGSGKSRLARELAPYLGAAPGARVVRTDVLRKRMVGVHPTTKLPETAYSREMSQRTYQAFYDKVLAALHAGHSVVADAVFSRPAERDVMASLADEAGVPFVGLWLEAPPEVMMERTASRTNNASDADPEVVRMQLDYDLGEIAWNRLDSSGSREETLREGLRLIGL